MKHLFPIAICLLVSGGAHAQSTFSSEADSVIVTATPKTARPASTKGFAFQRYKWDASVDASFALPAFYQVSNWGGYGHGYGYGYGYNYGGYGYSYGTSIFTNTRSTRFMVRKNETVLNDSNIPVRKGAYRLSLQLSGGSSHISDDSIRFNSGNTSSYYFPVSNSSFGISSAVGYEWQQQVGRFQFIYGYDVFGSVGTYREAGLIRNAEGRKEEATGKSNYISAGVSPLAGVKFFVHPRFSLSLEGSYNIRYNRSRHENTRTDLTYIARNSTESSFSYGLTPLSAFNATFHFGKPVRL